MSGVAGAVEYLYCRDSGRRYRILKRTRQRVYFRACHEGSLSATWAEDVACVKLAELATEDGALWRTKGAYVYGTHLLTEEAYLRRRAEPVT